MKFNYRIVIVSNSQLLFNLGSNEILILLFPALCYIYKVFLFTLTSKQSTSRVEITLSVAMHSKLRIWIKIDQDHISIIKGEI